jgi:hypothetical protein
MLKAYPVSPFLAFGIPGFAPDEHLSDTQPNTGAAMSLIKQSDVKNHLSPHFRTKIHLCDPVSQPDATGYSVPETDAIKANASDFAKDFVAEHSAFGVAVATPGPVTGSVGPQAPKVSKSAQA